MNTKYLIDALGNNFSFDVEGSDFLKDIQVTRKTLEKGRSLYNAGDVVKHLYCVVEGWLTSTADLEGGDRQLFAFHVPIDIGGLEFISDERATSTLIAFEKAELYLIPVNQFVDAMERSPMAAIAIMKTLGRRYIMLQERMAVFTRGNAEAKIAHALLGLRSKQLRNGFSHPDRLRVPLTQADIADALGLTSVTVSRTFKALKTKGLVDFTRNHIDILDPQQLEICVQSVRLQNQLVDDFT
ncbi:MAG: Crp/Fnr family transcriptional regulator [Litorimonas sp.]